MDHKELDAWKKAVDLAQVVYELTSGFPKEEMFSLTSQMRRAAVSIASNIAEGCARKSDKELLNFLSIAVGSLAELETQAIIATRLGYLSGNALQERIVEVRRLLMGLVRYIKGKR